MSSIQKMSMFGDSLDTKKKKITKLDEEQANKDLELVSEDGLALEHVKTQTKEICLAAIRQDERALQFLKRQTKELCLEAVKQNGLALQ